MIETVLVKEAGYSLRDIRGTERREVRHEERTDLLAHLKRRLPWCDDPAPRRVVETVEEPGMSEHEVMRRLIYHDEMEEIKEEQMEDEQQQAQQSGTSGYSGSTPGGARPSSPSKPSKPSGASTTGGKTW